MAQCELDAAKAHPGETLVTSNGVGNYIRLCMSAAGYEFDMSNNKCQPSFTVEKNPFCYVPSAKVERWFYDLELWLA